MTTEDSDPPLYRDDDVDVLIAKSLGDKLQFLGFISRTDLQAVEMIVNDVVRHRWLEIGNELLSRKKAARP